MYQIAVIGAGSWGTALALSLNRSGHFVRLWSNEEDHVKSLLEHRENKHFLPKINLPEDILITGSLKEAVAEAAGIVMAVPSHAMREAALRLEGLIPDNAVIVSVAKGFEPNTLLRMSQVLEEVFPHNQIAVLSGPSHAEEVSRHMATAIVAASANEDLAAWVQNVFSNDFMRVYTNNDVIGVEIAGAMKNIIAMGCGICYGFGCGDNTEAAVLTRGLAEITRLGLAMGAKETTFSGLAGIGDLVVTCGSMHSRNRRAGTMLGQGKKLDEILASMGMVVEGVNATKNGYLLAQKYGVELPITQAIHGILYENTDINDAFTMLMNRRRTKERHEAEEVME